VEHVEAICTAIAQRRLIQFDYNGTRRLAYPCAHGILSTGNEALRAHEVIFVNGRRRTAMGRLYLLRSMSDVAVDDESFERPPHGYRRDDRGMASIHCQL
jgi:hypothetical protein